VDIKPEIRIVGFDDGPFVTRSKGKVPVVGVVSRGGSFLDGILRTDVEIDGMDATDKLIKAVNDSKHKQQLRIIMLNGITVGGFNLVDIKRLHEETKLPVIVVNRKVPDLKNIKRALGKFDDFKARWQCVKNAGKIYKVKIKNKSVCFQFIGLQRTEAVSILKLSSTRSLLPEPLRVAHMMASAIVEGEGRGRA